MARETNLGRAIKLLANRGTASPFCVWGVVSNIDKTAKTIDVEPLDESAPLLGCLLIAGDGVGNVIFPPLDSLVVVAKIAPELGIVVLFSQIDTMQLNGNLYGGLVKVQELTDKLNNLENAFNLHTHVLALSAGTGTAAPPANTLTPTTKTELENDTITHGNGN